MVGRLSAVRRQRRMAWGAALLLAALLHLWVGHTVASLQADWADSPDMPPRLQAAFVREMRAADLPAPVRQVPAPRRLPPALQHRSQADHAALPSLPEPEREAEVLQPLPGLPEMPAPEDLPAAFEPGPEWPASTQLDYRLQGNYRGEIHGQAQVQWLRQGAKYQVQLEVSVGPSLAPLIARRMVSSGDLLPQGISPRRYDEDTRVLLSARHRVSVLFEGGMLQFPNGRREPAPAGVQDASSQFVQLTWLFLTGREALVPGRVIELPLALPRRLYQWRYEVLGEEDLETPLGTLKTWHLRPTVQNTGSDLKAEVWLAPSLQYLPVRLRIAQDEQTYVDMMLKQAPLQAAEPIVQPKAESNSKESP